MVQIADCADDSRRRSGSPTGQHVAQCAAGVNKQPPRAPQDLDQPQAPWHVHQVPPQLPDMDAGVGVVRRWREARELRAFRAWSAANQYVTRTEPFASLFALAAVPGVFGSPCRIRHDVVHRNSCCASMPCATSPGTRAVCAYVDQLRTALRTSSMTRLEVPMPNRSASARRSST